MMSFKVKFTLFWVFCMILDNAGATIYKCVDDLGTMHYQKRACDADAISSIMDVDEEPEMVAVEPTADISKQYHRNPTANSQTRSPQTENNRLKKEQCNRLRKSYKQEQARIIQACKQARERYCDQSAEKIETLNLKRDIDNNSYYYPERGRPQLYLPLLFKLKKQLQANGC